MAKREIKALTITVESPLDVPIFERLNRVAKYLGIAPTSTARMLLIQALDKFIVENDVPALARPVDG